MRTTPSGFAGVERGPRGLHAIAVAATPTDLKPPVKVRLPAVTKAAARAFEGELGPKAKHTTIFNLFRERGERAGADAV